MRISGWSSDVCSSDLESVRSPCCEIRGVHPSHPLQYSSGRHLARSAGSASAPRRPPPTTTPALHHTLPLTRTTTTPSLRHGPPSPLSPPSRPITRWPIFPCSGIPAPERKKPRRHHRVEIGRASCRARVGQYG